MSWIAASSLLLGIALVAGFGWYERSHPSARVLALVAALAALAVIGRIAFAPLPNVKPTTDIVLLTGYVLGGAPGFAVGAVAALVSNLFFGQGPWTPWQMVGWGGVGLFGAALARLGGRELGRIPLAAACAVASLGYGLLQNVSLWITFSGDHSLAKLWFYMSTSFAFDVAHAVGSVLFCLAFGPALVRALRRYRMRFAVTWRPGPVTAGLGAALIVLALAQPPAADAAAPRASLRYLEAAQNADGGFGPAPGTSSTQMHTGWVVLGFAAADEDPRAVERGGKSALDFMRANAGALRGDLGERSRTMLALRAAGASPARLGGRDLLGELVRAQEPDGSFQGLVNTTAFAVMALRAAGKPASDPVVRRAVGFIAGQANPDGGFNFGGKGGPSGADDTGAALQALGAGGRRGARVTRRAADWLERHQNPDGGFSLQAGASNAQSTAWAIQGLIAAGRDPAKLRRGGARSPMAYLRSLVTPGGAIRYSRTSDQTPVWVTAQALTALAGKAFPLAPVKRKRKATTAAATPAPAAEPASAATPAPAPAPAAEGEPLETPVSVAVAAPVTPLRIVALGLPGLSPALAHRAGLAAAVATATLLPG